MQRKCKSASVRADSVSQTCSESPWRPWLGQTLLDGHLERLSYRGRCRPGRHRERGEWLWTSPQLSALGRFRKNPPLPHVHEYRRCGQFPEHSQLQPGSQLGFPSYSPGPRCWTFPSLLFATKSRQGLCMVFANVLAGRASCTTELAFGGCGSVWRLHGGSVHGDPAPQSWRLLDGGGHP